MSIDEILEPDGLEEALARLKRSVRDQPEDADLRLRLFELFSVVGEWDRAAAQLGAAARIDRAHQAAASWFRIALAAEPLRRDTLAGRRTPLGVLYANLPCVYSPDSRAGAMASASQHNVDSWPERRARVLFAQARARCCRRAHDTRHSVPMPCACVAHAHAPTSTAVHVWQQHWPSACGNSQPRGSGRRAGVSKMRPRRQETVCV